MEQKLLHSVVALDIGSSKDLSQEVEGSFVDKLEVLAGHLIFEGAQLDKIVEQVFERAYLMELQDISFTAPIAF